MKDIPVVDLLRADLIELRRELARCDAARLELRTALDASVYNVRMVTELLATLIHRGGEAGVTLTHDERDAAFEVCWLQVSIDVLEDDDPDVRNSVRVSLMPPTLAERVANDIRIKTSNEAAIKKAAAPGLELIDP